MPVLDLQLTESEHTTVLTTPITADWVNSPDWRVAFRKWAEAEGASDGMWLADLYATQLQIDYEKDGASADLWQQWLLYLPTDGSVPAAAMADIETLSQGQPIARDVNDVLHDMDQFIRETYERLVHTYLFGPFSEAIAAYKAAYGSAADGSDAAGPQAEFADDSDDHYQNVGENQYDLYPGTPQAQNEYDLYPGGTQVESPYGVPIPAQGDNPYDSYPAQPQLAPVESLIDADAVEGENQQALKEAHEPGSRLPFWQIGANLLLGPGHPPEYYQHFLERGAASGWVTVVSRGSTLRRDPGLIQVAGSNDPSSFAAAIAEFSNKRVEFV
jgi:hypothetical protein